MSPSFWIILTIAVFVGPLYTEAQRRCTHNNQCSSGECCSIGRERYSIPVCRREPRRDESCHPSPIPVYDTVYTYPNGEQIRLESGYNGPCPCRRGETCSRHNAVCRPS